MASHGDWRGFLHSHAQWERGFRTLRRLTRDTGPLIISTSMLQCVAMSVCFSTSR